MISLRDIVPHRSFRCRNIANDAVAYISNSICAPAKIQTENKNKSRENNGIAAKSEPTQNPIHLRKIAFSPDLIWHFFPGILKNANINLTFNRLLSQHTHTHNREIVACAMYVCCAYMSPCAIVQLYNDLENMLHAV